MHRSLIYSYYYGQQGGAVTYSVELQAWIDAGTLAGHTLPNADILSAIDALLGSALETGTIISRMKTGYIFHAGSKGMAKLNLKDPATFPLTEVGTVTFSEGNGCKSASSSYFDQPFRSNQYAGIQSNLTCAQYISESDTTQATQMPHGFRSGFGLYFAYRPRASSQVVLNFDGGNAYTSANHKALFVHGNDGSNSVIYRDGVKSSFVVAATAPTDAINRYILARNNNGVADAFYTRFVSYDFLFDRFSDADELAFRTASNNYKTAVGLP